MLPTSCPQTILATTAVVSVGVMALSAIVGKLTSTPAGCPAMPGRVRRLRDALFEKAGGHGPANKSMMPVMPPPELREIGSAVTDPITGTSSRQSSESRLYMQMRILDVDLSKMGIDDFIERLVKLVDQFQLPCVMYRDTVTNGGVGILTWSRDPEFFITNFNPVMSHPTIANVFAERKDWTMFGKTYSNGHEKDLDEYLFKKPIRTSLKHEWAIWYPLRRKSGFYVLPPGEQCQMLLTHAAIGKAFADVHAANDVRLKCFGMDPNDNEYVVGILGADLHPLSRVVEEMRKTRHTAEYIDKLGPFFVGKKIHARE
jgi:hypothetical protein